MGHTVKVIASVTRDVVDNLVQSRVSDYDCMPQLPTWVKDTIKRFLEKHVGYDTGPICCVSRVCGQDADLAIVGTGVSDHIPLMPESILLQFSMPEDQTVSISNIDLFEIISKAEEIGEEYGIEELEDTLKVGALDPEFSDVFSFIPHMDIKNCQYYGILSSDWGLDNSEDLVKGIPRAVLPKLTSFSRGDPV